MDGLLLATLGRSVLSQEGEGMVSDVLVVLEMNGMDHRAARVEIGHQVGAARLEHLRSECAP